MLSEDDSANNALAWLETDGLLVQFGTRRARAVAAYEHFVQDGIGGDSIWQHLNRQVFLGDDAFIARSHRPPRYDRTTSTFRAPSVASSRHRWRR